MTRTIVGGRDRSPCRSGRAAALLLSAVLLAAALGAGGTSAQAPGSWTPIFPSKSWPKRSPTHPAPQYPTLDSSLNDLVAEHDAAIARGEAPPVA